MADATTLTTLPAHRQRALLAAGEVSSVELTRAHLDRSAAVDGQVKAYLAMDEAGAIAAAEASDARRANGENAGLFDGIPVALKDNLSTNGLRTTCASKMLESYVPVFDATVVARLRAGGAVFVGKTNMDEFAFGSSTENSAFGATRNPWDLDTVPGGSSGGSAAAVASGQAAVSLGSDTGGSIRQPASLCGVVGLKPTYGRVSRYGLVAFASSLDQIGPFSREVRDSADLLTAISGHDTMDSTSVPGEVPDFASALTGDLSGVRLAVVKELVADGLEPEVRVAFEASLALLKDAGATIDEVSLPSIGYSLPAYYLIAPSEASSNLSRFDAVRYGYRTEKYEDIYEMYVKSRGEGFGAEAKRRIMLGTYALSAGYYDAYYGRALKARTVIKGEFDTAFKSYDALLSPTTPSVAFRIGEKSSDPLAMYLSDVCTVPVNLAGIPAVSVPCGKGATGLPIGLQVMGAALGEEMILKVAHAYEARRGDFGVPAGIDAAGTTGATSSSTSPAASTISG